MRLECAVQPERAPSASATHHAPTHTHSPAPHSLHNVGMLSCHGCDGGRCGYSVSYTEGSSIRGHLVYDSFSFGSADGGERRVRASFGCQTYESGLFQSQACCLPSLELLHLAGAFSFTSLAASRSFASSHHRRTHPPQVADGITGLSQSQRYGPTLFDYLRAATNAPNVFSICLSEEVGALVLGGGVPSHLSAEWIPYSGSSTYAVGLTDITVGGRSIGERSSAYHNTIIDSGTTFMYLPPGAYRKVWRVEASPTQGTSLEGPILFRGLSPGLCSKRPRRSVRVPLYASRKVAPKRPSGTVLPPAPLLRPAPLDE